MTFFTCISGSSLETNSLTILLRSTFAVPIFFMVFQYHSLYKQGRQIGLE